MQAHILVLRHDPPGAKPALHVDVLRGVESRGSQACAQLPLLAIARERDAVHGADVDAGVALDAQLRGEDRLHVAVEAALRLLPGELGVEAELRKHLTAPAQNLTQDLYVSEPLKTKRVMVKDEDVCLHCGLCAERCPTGAWDMQKFLLEVSYANGGKSCQAA